ncbi:MAG: hypothetical protein QNJ18_04470 [Xenococcaceae cyanobacterium MO_167.B52]|nr:hypothetical protein [Xenococcaceae cyanobacterium MO_167.B52]
MIASNRTFDPLQHFLKVDGKKKIKTVPLRPDIVILILDFRFGILD